MKKIVLLRHGESTWNRENRLTGWTDADLIEKGVAEAEKVGEILKEYGFNFDKAYTSYLKCAVKASSYVPDKTNLDWIFVEKSWRLNEKHYGELQGLNKVETAERYGEEQVLVWRRSYDITPHPFSESDSRDPRSDYRYHKVPDAELPRTESLKDTIERIMPYRESDTFSSPKAAHTLSVVTHGNGLRGIIRHLKNIPDEDTVKLNLSIAVPYVFEFDENLNVANDHLLGNPEGVKRLMETVANQGKKKWKSYTLKREVMSKVIELLRDKACYHLDHTCETTDKSLTHIPSPDTIDKIWIDSDRSIRVLNNLQTLSGHGRLANTGYVSILPVDQDIEYTAGASSAPNPIYFDPENIVKLAVEGGCNGVVSTFGILGSVARKYAHKTPFTVKLNHNELLSYPNSFDQVLLGTVKEAWNMEAVVVGATIYFGLEQSRRQLVEIVEVFEYAHELGMATILWCYLRNNDSKKDVVDYHVAADLTGQADRLGVTIKADTVRQKLLTNNGGFRAIGFGKVDECMYIEPTSEHPIGLCRYQVANGYMGYVGLTNSGGKSHGSPDSRDAVTTVVVSKRTGGMGLISGRKAFQKPMNEGMELLNAIQDVYLDSSITIA